MPDLIPSGYQSAAGSIIDRRCINRSRIGAKSHFSLDFRLDVRQLRYFIAVAEELHFGRAAARLDIAQPPLSRQIAELEAGIGVQLFDRSRSQIRLTQAGNVLQDHARRLIEHLEEAVRETRSIGKGRAGRLRIGFSNCVASGALPRWIRSYRQAFPEVDLVFSPHTPKLLQRALIRGEIDIAVTRQLLADDAFHAEQMLHEPLVVAAEAGMVYGGPGPCTLAQLSGSTLITYPSCDMRKADDPILSLCRSQGFEPAHLTSVPDMCTALALVAMGAGVALVPASAEAISPPELRLHLYIGDNPGAALTIGARLDNRSPQILQFFELTRREARRPVYTRPAAEPGYAVILEAEH